MQTCSPTRSRQTNPLTLAHTYAVQGLQLMGLWPVPDQLYPDVEDRIAGALAPVRAPSDFRQELASNLALIAQHKSSGLIIKPSRPYRPGILIGLGAGALATGVAVVVLLLKSRIPQRASH